ncbi:MAG: nuclear transport factor 2 family protein [Pseudomonadota bacterium]
MDRIKIARRFFAALEANDLESARALCADNFQGSQNGGPAIDLESLMQFTAAVHKVVPDFRYEDATRWETQGGFVEEHSVCGTLPDGDTFKLILCVVGEVAEGKIMKLREYVDSAAAAALLQALRST